jgi:serine phosphatase RsbU (regulator of sigma subunit)
VLATKKIVQYQAEEISINPGDRLLIYSDGIPEAMNEQREEFGDEKLLRLVEQNHEQSSEALIYKITAALNAHFGKAPQNDDMTMILLARDK